MKLFGYTEISYENTEVPESLTEVTFVVNPEELRKMAKFFNKIAQEIETNGTDFEHGHLSDTGDGFLDAPRIIVYNDANS